ncbi:MAG: site-specific integrase [Pseudolabrys sp.]
MAEIETAKGPVTRNRVRSSLSAFFNFLIREGLLNVSPVAGTGTADEVRSRERVLTDAELAEVWRGLRDDRFGNIVRLLILTGQRRDEIGSLRLSEVDLERELIVLPPDRTKNKRQHEVPLSKQAKAILERAINGAKSSSVIKGSSATALGVNDTKVFGGFLGYHDRKGWLDQQIKLKEPWRLHDLRRTAATGMADKLGVLPHIVEAILNHVSGHRAGVAGIYNRAKYENEMRDALQRWSDYIEGLTAKPLSSQPQQGQGLAY